MNNHIKISIAKTQRSLIQLLTAGGWEPQLKHGHPSLEDQEPLVDTLDKGVIPSYDAEINLLRSMRIPERVSLGHSDLAMVGTDCLEETQFPRIVSLGVIPIGRTFIIQPSLELWAHPESEVYHLENINDGAIVLTERPNFTSRVFTEDYGRRTEIQDHRVKDPLEFRTKVRKEGLIGITIIPGGGPQELEPDELLVIVNETGRTRVNYGMRKISTLCDIDTHIIANEDSLRDPEKKRLIEQFVEDIEGAHKAIEQETTQVMFGIEREPIA